MKTLVLLVLCCAPAFAQKLNVQIVARSVDGIPYTSFVPGFATGNASATGYGSSVTGNASSLSMPAHEVHGEVSETTLVLLLPDGRKVTVSCRDHFWGLTKSHLHACSRPIGDQIEANFSGKNAKLKFSVGIDDKKKETETYIVTAVAAAPAK